MDLGGNNAWRTFWEEQRRVGESVWDETSLEERYGGEVGEEWKERLACKVEGREYMGLPARPKKSSTMTPTRTESPLRTASPGMSAGLRRKEQNEAFFARKGGENVNRPADLPPSQGGKYAGFGSEPPALSSAPDRGAGDGGSMPGVVEFQKDPVAALTKGLGWFTTTVGRGAKTVNDGWIQPTAQKVCLYSFSFPGSADLLSYLKAIACLLPQTLAKSPSFPKTTDRPDRPLLSSPSHRIFPRAKHPVWHQRRCRTTLQAHRRSNPYTHSWGQHGKKRGKWKGGA